MNKVYDKATNNKKDTGYLIRRINITAGRDVTVIGKRFQCGKEAVPYDTERLAVAAAKRQEKQDQEYCPECVIKYEIFRSGYWVF